MPRCLLLPAWYEAGKNIQDYCDVKGTEAEDSYDLGIEIKGAPSDFCTKIDVLNEDLVTHAIKTTFPNHKIIGEERYGFAVGIFLCWFSLWIFSYSFFHTIHYIYSTGTGTIPPLTADKTWIIDPIDGTERLLSMVLLPLCEWTLTIFWFFFRDCRNHQL